jgi:hypothetical protein
LGGSSSIMSDPHESVTRKVHDLFARIVGERSRRLDGTVVPAVAMEAISGALAEHYGPERAQKVAFHMADWNGDAAFVVAVHLFPEEFTAGEIEAGIGLFMSHAPNHIRAACSLTGLYVWENFPEDDETTRNWNT